MTEMFSFQCFTVLFSSPVVAWSTLQFLGLCRKYLFLLSCIDPDFFSLLTPWPDDGKFAEAVRVLLTWLERGEVNRRNANNFYSMIQSSNSHIRRLMSEKSQHEKEMEEAKEKFKTALAGILAQCEFYILNLTPPSRLRFIMQCRL